MAEGVVCVLPAFQREEESDIGLLRAKLLSYVRFFVTPWTVAPQAPLSLGFSRQEYCSGLPCPPPGDLPNPGIQPMSLVSPVLADTVFTPGITWKT